ncbi:hypothetical protein [Planococcus versutus]|uniref:Uncharacterized protein n=1 Tax=Planococcus versutus TaxID=1302659 RepID=A0A1B1S5H2_9BACL|nr:hypothetical protein [Planococcus versutus]ANU28442.1 hypothetical protein I858_015740 [Planococcus versutus]
MRTIQQQLKEKGLTNAPERTVPNLNTNTRLIDKECLSRKEWEELMGMNRQTYQKHNGAIRRKR